MLFEPFSVVLLLQGASDVSSGFFVPTSTRTINNVLPVCCCLTVSALDNCVSLVFLYSSQDPDAEDVH